ncbi:peptidoglycan editing factor PgeF [Paenibacillus sp. P96]|uniref:Purine nucleoside phosphorylase n=2 Tax=Paenibacillus zeirhizosphaerae TaxID=2987519 RepID=A0ABT9FQI8_9BACL|nr:peptidoglycan editing factor PgeF [Paenibacillus sp. P96]MDP4096924.1 peptidoglycan editing factor PgeF [Paenibacillus sp. P96]
MAAGGPQGGEGYVPELLFIDVWREQFLGLTAGFTSRRGGVGKEPYSSLNCALHVGEHPDTVITNRELIARRLGFEPEAWTCGEQVHGNRVVAVKEEDRGRGFLNRESAFQDADGLVTDVPGILLTSFYADCVPLFFIDPVRRVVGLAHAGWKGTVSEIAVHMVETMVEEYGSKREDLRAAIGPSIGLCCYEVDEVVMDRIMALEADIPGNEVWEGNVYTELGEGKWMLDLKQCNRQIMMKAGILPTHIECTTLCTSCNNDLFFSHRKEKGLTGRMASWIGLEKR